LILAERGTARPANASLEYAIRKSGFKTRLLHCDSTSNISTAITPESVDGRQACTLNTGGTTIATRAQTDERAVLESYRLLYRGSLLRRECAVEIGTR
jgi:hypothetical protein